MDRTAEPQRKRVLIVAGEASGDLHGSNLLRAARDLGDHLEFFGVGGPKMHAAGCDILFSCEELAVMGLVEVISQLPRIRRCFKRLEQVLTGSERPDLLLLIDYPGFNLRLAKVAKEAGVPVLFYIAPKVWAWKKGRIKVIGQRVDRLALIFPFEPPLYAAEQGLRAEYVGNPLLDEFAAAQPLERPADRGPADSTESPMIGIFPGSRQGELKYILETLLDTAELILQQRPGARFILPVAPTFDPDDLTRRIGGRALPIELSRESIYTVASGCDAVLCVSGTVTLQTALCRTPMAVVYKAAQVSYLLGSMLVKIPHFSLVNIVAGREVVREFLQHQAEPQALAAEVLRLLEDVEYRARVTEGLDFVCRQLGEPGCSARVARMAAEMCLINMQNGTLPNED